jgi:hypothetical protein
VLFSSLHFYFFHVFIQMVVGLEEADSVSQRPVLKVGERRKARPGMNERCFNGDPSHPRPAAYSRLRP